MQTVQTQIRLLLIRDQHCLHFNQQFCGVNSIILTYGPRPVTQYHQNCTKSTNSDHNALTEPSDHNALTEPSTFAELTASF